jgi:hypothetical protein
MKQAAILAALAFAGAACSVSVTPGVDAQARADCEPHKGLQFFEADSPLRAGGIQGYRAHCRDGALVARMYDPARTNHAGMPLEGDQ